MVMVRMEASALLCLCGLAARRPFEHSKEYGFYTNYLNWKEKLIDSNPNIKFTTVCSFDPTNISKKYFKNKWKERDNITSFDELKKMVPKIFADECWGFHSLNELDLSQFNNNEEWFSNNISKMRVECSQIMPSIRMKNIHEKIISFDDYDYVIFLRPDSYFIDDIILKENSMSLMGGFIGKITENTPPGGLYFCTISDWDYCWIGSSKIMKEWVIHFANLHYQDSTEIAKLANKVVPETNKKFVGNRIKSPNPFFADEVVLKEIKYVENYLYNFLYIDRMKYEGKCRLGLYDPENNNNGM